MLSGGGRGWRGPGPLSARTAERVAPRRPLRARRSFPHGQPGGGGREEPAALRWEAGNALCFCGGGRGTAAAPRALPTASGPALKGGSAAPEPALGKGAGVRAGFFPRLAPAVPYRAVPGRCAVARPLCAPGDAPGAGLEARRGRSWKSPCAVGVAAGR